MENMKLRGRPVGSVSYSEVTLGDLFAALGTEKAKVRVDKRWAEAVGVVTYGQNVVNANIPPNGGQEIQFNVE